MSARNFHHPYNPYEIQLQLMERIYGLLAENKKIGIFESPTGTGKTLSLLCSTLTWLRENKRHFLTKYGNNSCKRAEYSDIESDSADEPDWIHESYEKSIVEEISAVFRDYEKHLDDLGKLSSSKNEDFSETKRRRVGKISLNGTSVDELQFIPGAYESDSEELLTANSIEMGNRRSQLDSEIKYLLNKLEAKDESVKQAVQLKNPLKIYFASRTHSQLNQFTSQLRLPSLPPSFPNMDNERVKFLSLGSRKQLCINDKVSRVNSEFINDACVEAVKNKQCSYYSRANDAKLLGKYRDQVFSSIHDIEDLVTIGKGLDACPYYSSREFIQGAEVITLPYQHLLLASARETLGINLNNAVIVIDEAHNLIDTINSLHSASISLSELKQCRSAFQLYLSKFRSRLNSGNRVNILKLSRIMDVLIQFIEREYKQGKQINNPDDILSGSNADTINIHKLEKYMKRSKIAFKIDSFVQHAAESAGKEKVRTRQPILFKVVAFLNALMHPSKEGQFFFESGHVLKYMLLESAEVFKDLVSHARCIILAGGTMEPMSEFVDSLFPYVVDSDIVKYSCDHVIPDENLNTFIATENFEFTFDKRHDLNLILELFDFIFKLAQKVPYGMVVFFSSYKYLDFVVKLWRDNSLYAKLNAIKSIFAEEEGADDILLNYTNKIFIEKKGAILLAVVGGKLSEGINFENDLARAVVMVGLPFPNLFSGELLVKQKHLSSKVLKKGGSDKDASAATRQFYENICLRAVNQSVGRAIRHANDYANIYLVDKRYQSSAIKGKLSEWVRRRVQPETKVYDILARTEQFFKGKPTA